MDPERSSAAVRPKRARLSPLFAPCAVPVIAEAYVVEAAGRIGAVSVAPQASAFWPYGTLHDLLG